MWNPLKRKNKKLRELQKLTATFAILEEIARRGLLFWKQKDHILLIEESLATLKLAEGAKGFQHFLNQVALWQNYKLLSEAYEQHRIDIEVAAVRNAQKQYVVLSKADLLRIRQNARENMEEIEPDKLGYVREFDIMILRASAPSAVKATEENGQLLAVGHYDGKRVEMAMYEDIKHNLS